MGRFINNASIDELKSRINIVDEVAKVVDLKRAGANYKGCCPFHNEKTPSFVVSEQKQIFTCFGCGESGNVIKFTQRYYNLDFTEAVEKLAKENGITIQIGGREDKDRERYYEINREAARFFYRSFTQAQNPGYSYMKKRGIEDAVLKKFGIGYADEEWDSLYRYFKEKGVEEKILLELGLISENKGRYYDKFRNRVMFPIINTSGKVIGFGGRAIGDAQPKYLNSPENRVFQKKNNLYALNICKQEIGRENCAIMVEGYMDVISLYQGGVRNAIASLGTALTENQAKLIKRYTKNIVLSYDADQAGRKAALRGIDVLGAQECKVKVLHVTDGKDPDEFIKQHGKTAFLELVDKALPMIDYKLDSIRQNVDINTEEGKIDFVKRAAELLKTLSPVETDIYIKKLSKDLKIAEGAIRMEILGNNNGGEHRTQHHYERAEKTPEEQEKEELSPLELTLMKVLIMNPPFVEELLDKQEIMQSRLAKRVLNIMFELYGMQEDFDRTEIMERLEPAESLMLTEELEKIIIAGNEDKVFSECLRNWKLSKLLSREKEIIARLSLADEEVGENSIKELTEELMEVQMKIKTYGGRS